MIIRTFLLIIFAILTTDVRAQDNPFKIDDGLYRIYLEAQKHENDSERLAIADSMYRVSAARKDYLAQCVALVIRMRYYYNKYDESNLYKTIDRVQALSRKSGNLMYYYYAWALKANYLKNKGRMLAATSEAEAIKTQAEKDKNSYGIYSAMRMLANIHESRGEYLVALRQYQEALKYGSHEMEEQDISPIYRAIGWCYICLEQYEKAVATFDKGIETAKGYESRMACMMQKCFALYYMDRNAEFESTYRNVHRLFTEYGQVQPRYIPRLNVMHYCIIKEYDKAWAETRKVQKPTDRLYLESLIYKAKGDYRLALQITERLHNINDSMHAVLQQKYLAEMNAKIGNTLLKNKTQELALTNARLQAEEMKTKAHNRIVIFVLLMMSATAIILLLVVHGRKTQKLMADLRVANDKLVENNEELRSAREKAMEVDRMKSAFIQNISHEVRTPLNAICGFAQILTKDGDSLSHDVKTDMCKRVIVGTEQLTRMINEMIDISLFESGTLKLEMSDMGINDVCRSVVERLSPNTPNGVDLRFTTTFDDAATIHTDRMRVEQILQNYLTNAQKNTTEGYIELACCRQDRFVVFTVTDTGIGVPEDMADTIFKKFAKRDNFKQGVGLGLSVSLSIAKALGGEIGVDTDYHSGARFWFKLLM